MKDIGSDDQRGQCLCRLRLSMCRERHGVARAPYVCRNSETWFAPK
jgi:hypothetical protein